MWRGEERVRVWWAGWEGEGGIGERGGGRGRDRGEGGREREG